MVRQQRNLVVAAAGTTATAKLNENGVITHYVITTPNFTDNRTSTISILDLDGVTIYTGNAHNESVTALVSSLSIPCEPGYTVKVTLSGADQDGGTVVIKLFTENR